MLGGSLSATAKDAMSGAHLAMGAGNVLQQAPRLGDPTRMMEVDTDEVDATVRWRHVVLHDCALCAFT